MWHLTRAWPSLLVLLVLTPGCGGGTPTSPSTFGSFPGFYVCRAPTIGAMTATIDGAPWIPVMTRASTRDDGVVSLLASDCRNILQIYLWRFSGLGTYDVTAGDILVDNFCEDFSCGSWFAQRSTDVFGKTTVHGSGSITVTAYTAPTPGVEGSGAIEGTFAFTLVANNGLGGPIVTKAITNGRFGSRFSPGF